MKTLEQFIQSNHITLTATWTDNNPSMPDFKGDNWKCVLQRPGRRMTVYFSKGYGHNGAQPTADEVLDCLASDAAGVDNARGFEDWCNEYGYDTDSRRAEKTYHTCERQAKRLQQFLGDDEYQELLFDTERG